MAQRILSPIDLRSPQQQRGLSSSEALAESLTGILETVGRAEKVRQERLKLDTISTAMAGGASVEQAMAIANEQDPFSTGLRGGLQRVGSAFAPPGGGIEDALKQTIISEQLKRALSGLTPQEQSQAARVRAGIEPRASTTNITRPTEQTTAEKDFDRNVKVLTDRHLSGPRKGQLKANEAQVESARRKLRLNPNAQDIQPGSLDDQFEAELKGKPKTSVKGATFDKAFGKAAYDLTLRELKDAALSQGATEASVEADFNRWWDEQAAAPDPEGFGEFVIPRSEFQKQTEGFGERPDGTQKGTGFLGVLSGTDTQGKTFESTEFSTQSNAVKVKGKRIDFPSLVPTLTQAEVDLMMNDIIPNNKNIPEAIMQKAIKHAKERIAEGKGVFAEEGETPTPERPEEAITQPTSGTFREQIDQIKSGPGTPKQKLAAMKEITKKFKRLEELRKKANR